MRVLVRTAPVLLFLGVVLVGCNRSDEPNKGVQERAASSSKGGIPPAALPPDVTLQVSGMT
jgi:hypothetical protein